MSTYNYTLDSEQQKVYDKLKLIQPCMLPIYTSFQRSLVSSQTPNEYMMVCDNEATYFNDNNTEPELKSLANKYYQSNIALNARGILLGIQEEVAKIKVENKNNELKWYDLKGWVSVNLVGQPLFGVEENAIEWSKKIGSIYIPKSK